MTDRFLGMPLSPTDLRIRRDGTLYWNRPRKPSLYRRLVDWVFRGRRQRQIEAAQWKELEAILDRCIQCVKEARRSIEKIKK